MGSGGGNVFENIVKDAVTATSDVAGVMTGGISKDIERETKPVYDELTGENARKKKAAEKKAEKQVKSAQAKVKKQKADKDSLDKARAGAVSDRKTAAGSQSKKGKKGRRSTILTDTLGSVGGEGNQGKKSLLGY